MSPRIIMTASEESIMDDGKYIIGREDRRKGRQAPPPRPGERRRGGRYLELPHPTVSQVHAELIILGGTFHLRDLDSTNGTFILRDGSPEPVHEQYVELETPLQFGERRTTLRELLES